MSITESSHQGNRLPPNEEVPEISTMYEPYSGVQFINNTKRDNKEEKIGNGLTKRVSVFKNPFICFNSYF